MAKQAKKVKVKDEELENETRGTQVFSDRGQTDMSYMTPTEGVKIISKKGKTRALGLMDRASKFFGS